jgi:hypothetical protein
LFFLSLELFKATGGIFINLYFNIVGFQGIEKPMKRERRE